MTELPNFYPAYPEILLACAAMACMMVGVFVREERATGIVHYLALTALIIVGVSVWPMRGQELIGFNGQFVSDDFTVFMKMLIILVDIQVLHHLHLTNIMALLGQH